MSMLSTAKDYCPYCGELIELVVDPGFLEFESSEQQYTEDCFVCCRPIIISVSVCQTGFDLSLRREDE